MNINWWQSLLIALIPAVLTALISAIVAVAVAQKEIKNKTRELQEKYSAEKKLYINKATFESEYNILLELCEKTFTMVSDVVSNLFPNGVTNAINANANKDYYIKLYNICDTSFTAAHKAINKYACFLPEKLYNKFVDIKQQCGIQLRFFFFLKISCPTDAGFDEKECYNRTTSIEKNTENFIKELRKHIESLTFKEATENGD